MGVADAEETATELDGVPVRHFDTVTVDDTVRVDVTVNDTVTVTVDMKVDDTVAVDITVTGLGDEIRGRRGGAKLKQSPNGTGEYLVEARTR